MRSVVLESVVRFPKSYRMHAWLHLPSSSWKSPLSITSFDVASRDRPGRIKIWEALSLDDKSQVADAFAMLLAGRCLRLSYF